MISHLESYKFSSIISQFKNASLVNKKGDLLFSKDQDPFKTTTSRLVMFQITKKYLSPQLGDIIISNDPENGGTSLSRVFFISCLNDNLFLIWDAELFLVDFKIPLMPFLEKNKINSMVWQGLVESQPHKEIFSVFFNDEINKYKTIFLFKDFIQEASKELFQKQWFDVSLSIFLLHFEAKAYGQNELNYNYKNENRLKLRTEADEKQNVRFVKVDFSGTTLTSHIQSGFCCASHIIESGLIIEFSKFYQLEKYLSQAILNHVKLILPPKSIVTTAHKTGDHNFELQKIVRQMMKYNLSHINLTSKKNIKNFSLYSTHLLQMNSVTDSNLMFLSNSRIEFKNLVGFVQKNLQHIDGEYKASLIYTSETPLKLKISGIASDEDVSKRWLKINKNIVSHGNYELKKGDELHFNWKFI